METGRLSSRLELSFQCVKCVGNMRARGSKPDSPLHTDTTDSRARSLDSTGFFSKSDAAVLAFLRYSQTEEWQLVGQTGAGASNLPCSYLALTRLAGRAPTRSRDGDQQPEPRVHEAMPGGLLL